MAELAPTTGYPIALTTGRPASSNRLWAIPIIGITVKFIILIPHYIVLYVLFLVTLVAHLVIWIPVLFTARYPDWAWTLTAGLLRWYARVTFYTYGIRDNYPEFSMDAPGDILFERPETSSRFWAIPIIGVTLKFIILIPHYIILYVLGIVAGICQLVIWIPVLFTGQYPGWAFTLNAGLTLWTTRVYAYTLGLTDQYPPFSMS
jgi:hypothetical protein